MGAEENKAVVRRFWEELVAAADYDRAQELIAEDAVNREATDDDNQHGLAAYLDTFRTLSAAFEGHRFETEELVADGDLVACYGTWRGKHVGEFNGWQPKGAEVAVRQTHWFRLRDGKIVDHWANRDDVTMLRQLGVLPG